MGLSLDGTSDANIHPFCCTWVSMGNPNMPVRAFNSGSAVKERMGRAVPGAEYSAAERGTCSPEVHIRSPLR